MNDIQVLFIMHIEFIINRWEKNLPVALFLEIFSVLCFGFPGMGVKGLGDV
jgi:amino acid permease